MALILPKMFEYFIELTWLPSLSVTCFFTSARVRWLDLQSFCTPKPSDATSKGGKLRLPAYLKFLLFLRISLIWSRRTREKLTDGKSLQTCSNWLRCQVSRMELSRFSFSFSFPSFPFFFCLRLYWAAPFFSFLSWWLSGYSEVKITAQIPCNIDRFYISFLGFSNKWPQPGC